MKVILLCSNERFGLKLFKKQYVTKKVREATYQYCKPALNFSNFNEFATKVRISHHSTK